MPGYFYHRIRFFPSLLLVSLSFLLCASPVFSAQIGLAWDPNSESDLAGYKVYYGTTSRAYGAPISVGNVTAYTLTGLTSGQTYYIAVTAYDTSNNESGFSNEVSGPAVNPVQTYTYTFATSQSGLQVTVDGTAYNAPHTVNWSGGSSHTISVPSPQGGTGTRYVFSSWSDGGVQSHTITVPSSNTTYTANFTTQYSLTTAVSPSSAGTVGPSGVNWYNSGQSVSVSSTANPGYSFSSWSGVLTGSVNPASLMMNGPKSVTANFTQNQYTVTVSVSPSGSGSVTKNPNKSTYVYGDQMTLTSVANAGYSFSSWSGGVSGTTSPVTLTVNGNKAVTANLTAGSETVSIPTRPTGSSSGITGTSYSYSTGGSTSSLGHAVEYQMDWKGDGTDLSAWGSSTQSKIWTTAGTYQVRARARCSTHTTIVSGWSSAVSVIIAQATVSCTISTNPSGLQVTVDGSSYTAPRAFSWVPGSTHTVSVTSPQSGGAGTQYAYSSWSDGGGQSHTITVPSSATPYTANFKTQYSLTTSVSPSGAGTINPSGVNWYNSGQNVSVSATANAGYSFTSWTGGLTGSSNPSTLTMSGAKNVAATFTQQQPGRIALKAGSNLLSFPSLPGVVPLANLLSSISGQYDLVSAYEGCNPNDPWKIYDPSLPAYVNDLQNIDPTMGVWIEMTQDSQLNVSGSYPPTLSIPLCAGWNLISYAGNQARPITNALSSIAGKYLKVYTYKASDPINPWKVFDSSVPAFVNNLTTLEPGGGYWINVNQNCTFVINN